MKVLVRTSIALALALLSQTAWSIPVLVDAAQNSSRFLCSGDNCRVGAQTGLLLETGDQFAVRVDPTDLWSAGATPRWSNADGLVADLFATGSDESGQASGTLIGRNFGMREENGGIAFGALVGFIAGDFFSIGTSYTGIAATAGELQLFYWDSNSYDNFGSIIAEVSRISRRSVPEPSGLALLAAGLFILLLRRRSGSI